MAEAMQLVRTNHSNRKIETGSEDRQCLRHRDQRQRHPLVGDGSRQADPEPDAVFNHVDREHCDK
jgi:hypothetical protein